MARNQGWYDANAARPYPVDDGGTLVADGGAPLPHDVLVDANVRFPRSLGAVACLSSAAVTPRLVTFTFQVADGPLDPAPRPLAAVAVRRDELEEGRLVPLRPQADGVAGWVVVGPRAGGGPLDLRFSSPAQAPLCPRSARPFADPAVPSLARWGAAGLAGVVRLSGQPPVVVERAVREIEGVSREVIVVRLEDPPGTPPERGVLARLAGPCGGRPESGGCGPPAPLESVAGVAPDCDGVLTLEFRGCADAAPYLGGGGLALDCGQPLATACPPPDLPDDDGRLPGEADPLDYSHVVPPVDRVEPDTAAGLPFTTCWRGGDANGFVAKSGHWSWGPGGDPYADCEGGLLAGQVLTTEGPDGPAYRHVAVWEGPDTSTVRRRVFCDLWIGSDPFYVWYHGGLVLNRRADGGHFACFINYDNQTFQVRRFGGGGYTTLVEEPLPYVMLGVWYRLDVTVDPGARVGEVILTATVAQRSTYGPYAPITRVLGPYTLTGYGPADGRFGLIANRSSIRFGCFHVEEHH